MAATTATVVTMPVLLVTLGGRPGVDLIVMRMPAGRVTAAPGSGREIEGDRQGSEPSELQNDQELVAAH
jgi:hypothetical protein